MALFGVLHDPACCCGVACHDRTLTAHDSGLLLCRILHRRLAGGQGCDRDRAGFYAAALARPLSRQRGTAPAIRGAGAWPHDLSGPATSTIHLILVARSALYIGLRILPSKWYVWILKRQHILRNVRSVQLEVASHGEPGKTPARLSGLGGVLKEVARELQVTEVGGAVAVRLELGDRPGVVHDVNHRELGCVDDVIGTAVLAPDQ